MFPTTKTKKTKRLDNAALNRISAQAVRLRAATGLPFSIAAANVASALPKATADDLQHIRYIAMWESIITSEEMVEHDNAKLMQLAKARRAELAAPFRRPITPSSELKRPICRFPESEADVMALLSQ
ncbi:MAG: hypothetical protein H6835_18505 [Planctomycetes bacterium]|nr:hypothetical protein [Planctomycetota bacterium]